jgi:predicted acylesterase/phospholipase RssA
LGAIAMHGGNDAHALIRKILVASASVPGVFPPVDIDGEMHVDGGVTLPYFIAPAPAGAEIYVLIDGRLNEPVRATRARTAAILSRSVSAGLSRMLRTSLELTAAEADRDDMRVDYSAIPTAYPYRSTFDFSAATAKPLFKYGYDCASAGRLWTAFGQPAAPTVATPEAAALNAPTAVSVAGETTAVNLPVASSLPVINVVAHADVQCPADDALIASFAVR